MKVVLLAPASSVHTMRWANGLAGRGLDVHVVSLHHATQAFSPSVILHALPFWSSAGYIVAARALRGLLSDVAPDLMNVHYATGYGLLARLSGFSPLLLSVWGADVYDFPRKSPVHRRIVRANLRCATQIASTSHCMARMVRRIYPAARVAVTPFGVDEEQFQEIPQVAGQHCLTVGTVKTLTPKYGVDTLIQAFARLRPRAGVPALRLEITGDGPARQELESLSRDLGLGSAVVFHGEVSYDRVPSMLARLDIFVALSRLDSESFGVAAVEAAMCALPVVVSDVEGLAEVVEDGTTGFVVPRDDPDAAAQSLDRLISSAELRRQMGDAGRERALKLYTWRKSLDIMIETYKQTIAMRAQCSSHRV
ncbi:MAG TPA: glycosyltransferase [Gammaproteobacteria bacterium]|nr:glycosyltransferase [Gammaproteobacteria bacterium]